MAFQWVVPLSGLGRDARAVAGGKAANLGELLRAGFPVPPGFCVTTRAYAQVAAGSDLGPVLEALSGLRPDETDALAARSEEARTVLLEAPMPSEVAHAVREAYRALGTVRAVAVRSSATAEDLPDASFAGQQDTFLNVLGEDAVLKAVQQCWASLFTVRAVTYRAKHGMDARNIQLAVGVQQLIEAQVAGVLFTANPITGRRHRAVLDASPGLGEAVVSGAVNPDHFELDTLRGEILERRLGDKRVVIQSLPGGGTQRLLREANPVTACLTDEEVLTLARMGARVEAHYGAPQDLEWALDETRRPWLLQSRPITTLYPLPEKAPREGQGLCVYFNLSVAQGVNRPFTPMGLQAWRLLTAGLSSKIGFPVADPTKGAGLLTSAAGRLMVEATPLLRSDVGRKFVRFVLQRMEARSAEAIERVLEDPRLREVHTPRPWLLGQVLKVFRRTFSFGAMWDVFHRPERVAARFHARSNEVFHSVGEVPPGAGSDAKLKAVHALLLHGAADYLQWGGPVHGAGLACLRLSHVLLKKLAAPQEIDVVLRGLPNNPTTEMDLELWHVAERLRQDADSARLLSTTPPAEVSRRFQSGEVPVALKRELSAFLERYGFRSIAEIDLGMPRWRDDPTQLVSSLANYLALTDPSRAPDAQFRRGAEEAEAQVRVLCDRARRRGLFRGVLAQFLLRRVRLMAGIREMPKFHVVRILGKARALLREVGAEWVQKRLLDQAEDVFFLDWPQLCAVLAGEDPKPWVRAQRAWYERELGRKHLPRWLLSDGTEPLLPAPPGPTGELSGAPASAGTVTGRARVVLDPVGARLEPGEILVAPSTDPGWTPLFLTASALVMEMGGAMSHGAVVAREYGIPAVVGVPHATTAIVTGQRITVDGAAGTVRRETDATSPVSSPPPPLPG